MQKLVVKTPKPRNPWVAAALMRRAGSHRATGGALRQRAKHLLRRETEHPPLRRP